MTEDKEEKGAVDFVVEDVYKDFKNTYGDLSKKKSTAILFLLIQFHYCLSLL